MYGGLAGVYDSLADDFDYPAWARYYARLIGCPGGRVCECGCGTGNMALELAKLGYALTGVDISEDMLSVAAEKARRAGARLPLVRQDMRYLELPRAQDAIIACCDGVNYLTTPEDARAFFSAARRWLKPGGLLVFDVSTPRKLGETLGNAFFGEERDEVAYLWQNAYDAESRLLTMDITFFELERDGLYRKFRETHSQRAHAREELLEWLSECGFADARAYGDRTDAPASEADMRWHFAARRE